MKDLIKRTAFPIILFGSISIIYWFDNSPTIAYVMMLIGILIAVLLERYIPYQKDWNVPKGDTKIDIIHFIINSFLGSAVKVGSVALVAGLGGLYAQETGINFWISDAPLVLQIISAIIISGFLPYWIHRWSHESTGVLWRIHSVHHSSERLYWANAVKFHPFNSAWNVFFSSLPLLLLGVGEEVIFLSGIISNYVAFFNHTNIDFRLGWMTWVFNMNELHRWHHSKKIEEANSNYSAGAFVFWDIVFGTRLLPSKIIKEVGLFENSAKKYPMFSYWKQLLYPFKGK